MTPEQQIELIAKTLGWEVIELDEHWQGAPTIECPSQYGWFDANDTMMAWLADLTADGALACREWLAKSNGSPTHDYPH